jgi:uncharacterized protein YdaU (DUF1376 family)
MNPPKMPIHIGDYKRDTGHLRAAGHGAYLMLLFHHWSTGSLPDDDDQLAAIACMTRGEWKRIRPIIEKFFQPGWRHGRVEEDLESAKQSYEKRAKAGEKGGKAKAESKQSSSNATAGPEQPLTFNLLPKLESCPEPKPVRTKQEYSEEFEAKFWDPYPRSPTMSKKEAWREWMKLEPADRGLACQAIEPYRRFLRTKPNLETVHACRFLSQRRFEGFVASGSQPSTALDIRSSLV